MKKAIPIVIVIGMLGWALFDFIGSSTNEEVENDAMSGNSITSPLEEDTEEVVESDEVGLERGMIAPDFEVMTLNGEQVKLSDYRGERVLLNFWATWCPPCRAEMPDMQKLYEEEDVTILALNMTETENNVERVEEFIDELGLTFPVLMDETSDVMTSYKVQVYPTSYMIDSNGRIQYITLGAMNYDQMLQQMSKID
ncbi:TlpA disulfide reductase family protein [Oceanobacillus sp. FSL K6-2867]|uniref:peroxiredoxin family protein n=1 Tax=Oceanobacillus sp. FSL K6-2867 TaxID=2954748 RepID=UPI0030D7DFEC